MAEQLQQQRIEGDVTAAHGAVRVAGRLTITGDVLAGADVAADGDIVVRGRIDGARVESTGGGVYVDQGIVGKSCLVRAFGDVKSPFVRDATVECYGSAYVADVIYQASVRARNLVEMKSGDGLIDASYVEAGMEVNARTLGSLDRGETVVALENFRQRELFEVSMVYEQRLRQKEGRIAELSNTIDVIRILGARVVELSAEKKQELAQRVKEWNELREQVAEIEREKKTVFAERDRVYKALRSVVATGMVYPGVEVRIDNARARVGKKYQNVIFYRSGIVIIGDLDSFMKRKRLTGE